MLWAVLVVTWQGDSAPSLAVVVPAFEKAGGNLCSNYSGISFQDLGILSTSEGITEREV